MNICILSMHNVNNYGSVLQAYSLKKMVEDLGHEVSFIDIKIGEDEALNNQCKILCNQMNTEKKRKCINLFIRFKNKLCNLSTSKMYDEFRINKLEINNNNQKEFFDVCIIGSDEVFNCIQLSKWGFDSQLFGNITNAKKVITYAACCGSTKENNLSDDLRNAIKNSFKKVSSFSVRDENTKKFVQSLTDIVPVLNFDPVAVGNFNNEISNCDIKKKLPNRYCIIYAYENRINDDETIKEIIRVCKEKDMKPIAVFGKQKWISDYVSLKPFELLKAFREAEYVITDTFHGTLFGAKFSSRIAIIIRDSNKNKLNDLVTRLHIENHIVCNEKDIETLYNVNLNRNEINNIFSSERKKTLNYLAENI